MRADGRVDKTAVQKEVPPQVPLEIAVPPIPEELPVPPREKPSVAYNPALSIKIEPNSEFYFPRLDLNSYMKCLL